LRAGFRTALSEGVEAVVTLDADGQHDPAEVPAFLATYARRTVAGEPTELIIGRRDFHRMPPLRRLSNWLGTVVLSDRGGPLDRRQPVGLSPHRARLMSATLGSAESGFAFEVEMIAICLREGWSIEWVPIRTIYGDEGSHIRPLRHLGEFLGATGRARRIARERRATSADDAEGVDVDPAADRDDLDRVGTGVVPGLAERDVAVDRRAGTEVDRGLVDSVDIDRDTAPSGALVVTKDRLRAVVLRVADDPARRYRSEPPESFEENAALDGRRTSRGCCSAGRGWP
jgi:hypothetical protein